MSSLPPADQVATYTGGTRRRRRRGISRKQAKRIARVGQWWDHLDTNVSWRVKYLHRADGARTAPTSPRMAPVVLERPGDGLRHLTYGELGGQYRLVEEPGGE